MSTIAPVAAAPMSFSNWPTNASRRLRSGDITGFLSIWESEMRNPRASIMRQPAGCVNRGSRSILRLRHEGHNFLQELLTHPVALAFFFALFIVIPTRKREIETDDGL